MISKNKRILEVVRQYFIQQIQQSTHRRPSTIEQWQPLTIKHGSAARSSKKCSPANQLKAVLKQNSSLLKHINIKGRSRMGGGNRETRTKTKKKKNGEESNSKGCGWADGWGFVKYYSGKAHSQKDEGHKDIATHVDTMRGSDQNKYWKSKE